MSASTGCRRLASLALLGALAAVSISAGCTKTVIVQVASPSPTVSPSPSYLPSYSPPPERVLAQIKITVTGNYVGKLNVTWRDADGLHTQVVNNPSYWTKEVPVLSSGSRVELSAVTLSKFEIGVLPRCEITSAFGGKRFALGKPEYKQGHWQCHAGPVTLSAT